MSTETNPPIRLSEQAVASGPTRAQPVLISQENATLILGLKTTKTIRNMITRGELTAYRIRGVRAVRVDANEVRALIETTPSRTGR